MGAFIVGFPFVCVGINDVVSGRFLIKKNYQQLWNFGFIFVSLRFAVGSECGFRFQ